MRGNIPRVRFLILKPYSAKNQPEEGERPQSGAVEQRQLTNYSVASPAK